MRVVLQLRRNYRQILELVYSIPALSNPLPKSHLCLLPCTLATGLDCLVQLIRSSAFQSPNMLLGSSESSVPYPDFVFSLGYQVCYLFYYNQMLLDQLFLMLVTFSTSKKPTFFFLHY